MEMLYLTLACCAFLLVKTAEAKIVIISCDQKNAQDAQDSCDAEGMTIPTDRNELENFGREYFASNCSLNLSEGIKFWMFEGRSTGNKIPGLIVRNSSAEVSTFHGNKDELYFACKGIAASSTTTELGSLSSTPDRAISQDIMKNEAMKSEAEDTVGEPDPPPEKEIDEEFEPVTNIQKKLDGLEGDSLSRIKEFENNIASTISVLDDGTNFVSQTANVIVYRIDLNTRARGRANSSGLSLALPGNEKDIGTSRVEIPIKLIQTAPKDVSCVNPMSVILAKWKMAENESTILGAMIPESSDILTVSYYQCMNKMSYPVQYFVDLRNDSTEIKNLSPLERLINVSRTCAWLNFTTNAWDASGCETVDVSGEIECRCNHTTTFAVLLSVTSMSLPSMIPELSLAFEIASIACLIITILFLMFARYRPGIDSTIGPNALGMRSNRNNSQFSLCCSLLAMHSAIVWSDLARVNDDTACVAITFLTHYFVLTCALWSFNEGLGIFIKVHPNFTMNVPYRKLTLMQTVMGWAIPLCISLSCLIYGIQNAIYMDISRAYTLSLNKLPQYPTPKYDRCWLSVDSGMILAAVVPTMVTIVANIFILFYITKSVIKMNKSVSVYATSRSATSRSEDEFNNENMTRCRDQRIQHDLPSVTSVSSSVAIPIDLMKQKKRLKHLISGTRSFAILMPILGVPWILGIFVSIQSAALPFMIIHMLINGLQGVEIFILYCVASKTDWARVKRKWRNSKLKRMLSNYRYRRESTATYSSRVTAFDLKSQPAKVDDNANACVGLQDASNGLHYGTLSSARTAESSNAALLISKSPERNTTPC